LLYWRDYGYFPYERRFAILETKSLLKASEIRNRRKYLDFVGEYDESKIKRLTYFSRAANRNTSIPTTQLLLEESHLFTNGTVKRRQATRYSVHGLHEYKGKFNPQVVRSILNILSMDEGCHVLDPFCGSGTSLVECTHLGMKSVGIDMNPLATYIANAKLMALSTPLQKIKQKTALIFERYKFEKSRVYYRTKIEDQRLEYLAKWFPTRILRDIEAFHRAVVSEAETLAPIFLVLASNLLRDYSMQEPADLRIRRRRTPLPKKPFIKSLQESCNLALNSLVATQSIIGCKARSGIAYTLDSRKLDDEPLKWEIEPPFDCAVTSPPYATALPYVDTQRLSLVWLGLASPSELRTLEKELIGSREIWSGKKEEIIDVVYINKEGIPSEIADYCLHLGRSVSKKDGFRRQAVPFLLYRYFADMQKVFRGLRPHLGKGAPFALIVGHNHTILGGRRFDIDTPSYLVTLAEQAGWTHEESIPMQTYQRYGLHMNNAVASETLIIIRRT
jgi:site-specific DNA-methyltransferase (cytosine-N4-specific)